VYAPGAMALASAVFARSHSGSSSSSSSSSEAAAGGGQIDEANAEFAAIFGGGDERRDAKSGLQRDVRDVPIPNVVVASDEKNHPRNNHPPSGTALGEAGGGGCTSSRIQLPHSLKASAWFQPLNLCSENLVSKFGFSNSLTCTATRRCTDAR
jgi:hypothetical protein